MVCEDQKLGRNRVAACMWLFTGSAQAGAPRSAWAGVVVSHGHVRVMLSHEAMMATGLPVAPFGLQPVMLMISGMAEISSRINGLEPAANIRRRWGVQISLGPCKV